MNNITSILFILVYFVYILRLIVMSFRHPLQDYKYLFLSCYLVSIVINLGKSFYSPFDATVGAFGNNFYIGSVQIIPILLFVYAKKNITTKFSLKKGWLLVCFIILFCISLYNPLNISIIGTFIAIYNVLFIVLFAYIVSNIFSSEEIIKGFWDGLRFVTIIEFSFSILYPVLGFTNIPEIFAEAVFASETRTRANGTFIHPNTMGAFMSYVVLFWISCITCNYKKRKSLFFACMAFIALLLTISRSSILASIISCCFIFFINKRPEIKFFSFRVFFQFILPALLFVGITIFFTPLKKYFISFEAEDMINARQIHNFFYLNIVADHPYLGVGLNTGVAHFAKFYDDLEVLQESDELSFEFVSTQPVHNIYILLLVDVGIVGLILFLYFLIRNFFRYRRILILNKNTHSLDNIAPLTSMGCIIAVFVHGFSDHTPMAFINLSFWLLLCLITIFMNKTLLEPNKEENVENK